MSVGMYIAYSGAETAQAQLDIIANNVANASTTGFRRDHTIFDTVLGASMPFSGISGNQLDLSPGTHQLTKSPLHVAIDGPGFFVALDQAGNEVYTRRGDFRMNGLGELVLPGGQPVMGAGGSLKIPAGANASFRSDGTLAEGDQVFGRLRLVTFEDPSQLSKLGAGLISAGATAAPTDLGDVHVNVGFIEASNVNLAAEMVSLIQASRNFEAALQSLRVGDEMTGSLIQAQL